MRGHLSASTTVYVHRMLEPCTKELGRVLRLMPVASLLLLAIGAEANTFRGPLSNEVHSGPIGDVTHSRGRLKQHSSNRNGTQYFLLTSALPLGRGEGYYKNTMVSFNQLAFGLTKNLSVGAGLDVASLVTTRAEGPVWFGRMQLSGDLSDIVHIGVTTLYLNYQLPTTKELPEDEQGNGFGVAMGMFTLGDADKQISVCGGWGHDGKRATRGPVLNFAAAYRVFPNVSVITEHWILTDPDKTFPLHTLGIRVIGEYLALDAGLAYDPEITSRITPIGLPFIAATLNFGQQRGSPLNGRRPR